jgi:hypothetical protein
LPLPEFINAAFGVIALSLPLSAPGLLARTVADLEGADLIKSNHLAEATQYRPRSKDLIMKNAPRY